jgi:hypothetical protein
MAFERYLSENAQQKIKNYLSAKNNTFGGLTRKLHKFNTYYDAGIASAGLIYNGSMGLI